MFRINDKGERAEVFLYGTIGKDSWSGEGNSAKDFAAIIKELAPKPLDIRIDSGGGDVYEGFAMCSAIQRYEGETTAYIDGMAASSASYVASVCDRVVMNDYAWFMIHNAWTITIGNAQELALTIERLNQIDATIRDIITKRSGLSSDEVAAYMEEETWFNASEAMEAGICQEVIETEERMAACIPSSLASNYRRVPEGVLVSHSDSAEPAPHVVGRGEEAAAPECGASHTVPIIPEKTVVGRAIVLGNRVYHRKENNGFSE